MPKFFVIRENISDSQIIIDNNDVAHITRVLRLQKGDIIDVCDGRGIDYRAELIRISPERIVCNILSQTKTNTEANISVTLFQGIPKGTKMDYIIQKTTELGIAKIVPCIFSRCVVKLENKKAEQKKTERWRKIAEEAAKQSGRGIIPQITMPVEFQTAVAMLKQNDICFAPYESENQNQLKPVLLSKPDVKSVGFMIGPEGGYDMNEITVLKENQIDTITLGNRILRTETAGEAVLAMVMYEIGDINK